MAQVDGIENDRWKRPTQFNAKTVSCRESSEMRRTYPRTMSPLTVRASTTNPSYDREVWIVAGRLLDVEKTRDRARKKALTNRGSTAINVSRKPRDRLRAGEREVAGVSSGRSSERVRAAAVSRSRGPPSSRRRIQLCNRPVAQSVGSKPRKTDVSGSTAADDVRLTLAISQLLVKAAELGKTCLDSRTRLHVDEACRNSAGVNDLRRCRR